MIVNSYVLDVRKRNYESVTGKCRGAALLQTGLSRKGTEPKCKRDTTSGEWSMVTAPENGVEVVQDMQSTN